MNQHALALIKRFEGCRLTAYKDVGGVLTIGWGHTGKDVLIGSKITQAQANTQLHIDLKKTECGVINLVNVELSCFAMGALIDFAFNVGIGAFKSSTLLKKVNAKDPTACEQFLKWIYVKKIPIKGLQLRREEERKIFLTTHS